MSGGKRGGARVATPGTQRMVSVHLFFLSFLPFSAAPDQALYQGLITTVFAQVLWSTRSRICHFLFESPKGLQIAAPVTLMSF